MVWIFSFVKSITFIPLGSRRELLDTSPSCRIECRSCYFACRRRQQSKTSLHKAAQKLSCMRWVLLESKVCICKQAATGKAYRKQNKTRTGITRTNNKEIVSSKKISILIQCCLYRSLKSWMNQLFHFYFFPVQVRSSEYFVSKKRVEQFLFPDRAAHKPWTLAACRSHREHQSNRTWKTLMFLAGQSKAIHFTTSQQKRI